MIQYLITTERLGLRNWEQGDIETMAAINADPRVMEFFPATQSLEETVRFVTRMLQQFDERGYCYFAVDHLDTASMIGFIGLSYQNYKSPVTPSVDIGWRLSPAVWGRGLATEGAHACLDFAHNTLELDSVYAVAPVLNQPSIAVMKRIGMQWHCNFDHPMLADHPLLQKCSAYVSSRPG